MPIASSALSLRLAVSLFNTNSLGRAKYLVVERVDKNSRTNPNPDIVQLAGVGAVLAAALRKVSLTKGKYVPPIFGPAYLNQPLLESEVNLTPILSASALSTSKISTSIRTCGIGISNWEIIDSIWVNLLGISLIIRLLVAGSSIILPYSLIIADKASFRPFPLEAPEELLELELLLEPEPPWLSLELLTRTYFRKYTLVCNSKEGVPQSLMVKILLWGSSS